MKAQPHRPSLSISGFTLVELMVALVIGLIVVGAALAAFMSQRVTNTLATQVVDVQSDGRVVLDAIARDLRAAGDFGCWPVTSPIDKKLNNLKALDADLGGLEGFDSQALMPTDAERYYGISAVREAAAGATDGLASSSSVLAVSGVSGALSELAVAMVAQSDDLLVKPPVTPFKTGDIGVVTDCINWAKFQISGVEDSSRDGESVQVLHHAAAASNGNSGFGGGNRDAEIGELFGKGAAVGRLDTVWWFMGKVDGRAGLYRMSAADGIPVLVSERIVAISVTYDRASARAGANTVDDPGKTAAQIASSTEKWTGVRAATVQILLRSEKVGLKGVQAVTSFNGQSIDSDSHVYLPLQISVSLRNQ